MRVSNLEKILPEDLFIQIHRSYIVSQQKNSYLEGNFLKINEIELPIGQTYKELVYNKLNAK
ncbi:LytTR family transcriptional regulator DNA-binding domain-containing protein [Pedobacter metabolipauper]|uniref:LytTR family transcriptional regulator DNA-binding domain-containing protein n=1 Tax=Pedobacter metabolipauper TaxID=425513 RepID=UPI00105D3C7D|nr:LytTR family transcriptional regulator DNA-binding domain-containing protein [Pedobacter metabolipauper]